MEGQISSIKFMYNVIEVEGHEKSCKLTEGFILTLDVYLVESPPLSIVWTSAFKKYGQTINNVLPNATMNLVIQYDETQ